MGVGVVDCPAVRGPAHWADRTDHRDAEETGKNLNADREPNNVVHTPWTYRRRSCIDIWDFSNRHVGWVCVWREHTRRTRIRTSALFPRVAVVGGGCGQRYQ